MGILVVGSIALDTVRTQKTEKKDILGGSCTYFSVAASFFSKVQVVAAVGGDFPKKHITMMKKHNIDLDGLEVKKAVNTFRWAGTYAKNMNDRTTDDLQFGALGIFDPVLPEKYRKTKYVFLANDHPDHQLKVLKQMKCKPIALCDTIDHYINTENKKVKEVLKNVNGAILNDSEAMLITGESNAVSAAKALLKMGPKFMIVKKGEHGALLAYGKDVFAVPAYPLSKVADPTGAGDSFAGGVMGYLAKQNKVDANTLRKALAYGTATASFTCEDFSLNKLNRIKLTDINKRVNQFKKLVTIP